MKRLAVLFVCGALIASAQEVRLARPAILKSGRAIISLKAGTMVDVLERNDTTLTVRFNNVTGVIPASSLAHDPAAAASKPAAPKPSAPSRHVGSHYVDAVNKAKANIEKHNQNDAKQVDEVLKN
jgi:hypothetical protein